MSHHVITGLPDGRTARADYRQPVTHVMRRVNARITEPHPGVIAQRADLELIADWLDTHPEQACTAEQIRGGTCTHPAASPEPYRPPKYRVQPPVQPVQLPLFREIA